MPVLLLYIKTISCFNNISVISWWSVLLVEKTEGPEENHPSVYESVHYISAKKILQKREKNLYISAN
jgi:hypothetical protein